MSNAYSGVHIFDVNDISNILEVGYFDPNGEVGLFMISDSILYLTNNDNGLHILDISDLPLSASSVTLSEGWNLISLPFDSISSYSPEAVFGGSTPYSFEDYSYIEPDTLKPGKGYWLFSMEDTTLHFDSLTHIFSIDLKLNVGWNLIGLPYCILSPLHFDTLSGVIGPIYRFDTEAFSYNPLQDFESLHPLQGYWLLSEDTLSINIH